MSGHAAVSVLRFFFLVTLERRELTKRLPFLR
jgi:hypothetical protein